MYKDKEKERERQRKKYLRHKDKINERQRARYAKNTEKLKASFQKYFLSCKQVGTETYFKYVLRRIKARCSSKSSKSWEYYFGKGIKCHLTLNDIKRLWVRDHGAELKRPTVDRINSDQDYSFENCRFVEFTENCSTYHKRKAVLK